MTGDSVRRPRESCQGPGTLIVISMYPDNGQNWGQAYPGHRQAPAQHQWSGGTGWNPPVPLPGLMPNDRPARHSWEIPLLVVAIVLTVVAYVAAIAALFLGVVSTWVLIVLGGSGNGEQIAANKVKGARCALAWSVETAQLARQHNKAQLIGLGGRMHSLEESLAIVDAFLAAEWSNEERHQRRIDILSEFEKTGVAPALPEA